MLSKAFAQYSEKNELVLLRSEQLVGTAIFVFARKDLLPYIARVEGASRKVCTRHSLLSDQQLMTGTVSDRTEGHVRQQRRLRCSFRLIRYFTVPYDLSSGCWPFERS